MQNDLNAIKASTEGATRIWSATANRGNGKEAMEYGLAELGFNAAAQRTDVTPVMSAVLKAVAPVLNSGTTPVIKRQAGPAPVTPLPRKKRNSAPSLGLN